jgi:hypothetical protein
MRLGSALGLALLTGLCFPTAAQAAPWAAPLSLHARSVRLAQVPEPTSSKAPGTPATPAPTSPTVPASPPPQPTSSVAPPSGGPQPTSSRAPASGEVPDPVEYEPPVAEDPTEEPEEEEEATLQTQRRLAAKDEAFHRHGIGVRGGITIIPTWILGNYLSTHTNALCRGESLGDFAVERGLLKVDGCNFYVGPEYTYRFSRIFDLTTSVGYQKLHTPEGFWIDNGQYDGTAASLGGADYTEVDLHMMYMELDFVARAPIVVTENVEFGIGGGGGIGLGVLFGGVYQTPLGARPWGFDPTTGEVDFASCQSLNDLGDHRRCTPRWDAGEDGDQVPPAESDLETPNPNLFATCTKDKCSASDLQALGYRNKQGGVPPVIPVVNIILSARLIIKDAFGISLNGGFNTGFYFGGSMMYFFGPSSQDDMGIGPAGASRRREKKRKRELARR